MDYVDSNRQLIARSGFGLSRTSGSSMRPLIWGGRHCVVVAPLNGEPEPGDLLMFRGLLNGREANIVHRLIEIRRQGDRTVYFTRGDNCPGCEQVSPAEVIGRVVEVHRIGGFRPWYVIPARKFTVNDAAFRRYSRFWAAIWPVRRFYYRVRWRLRLIFQK